MAAVHTHLCFSLSNLKIITPEKQCADVFVPCQAFKGKCYSLKMGYSGHRHTKRSAHKAIQVALSGIGEVEVSSPSSEEFTFSTSPNKDGKLKVTVEVSGAKTQEVYDEVFSKMVNDAQPIRGFRRAKGVSKTLHVPSYATGLQQLEIRRKDPKQKEDCNKTLWRTPWEVLERLISTTQKGQMFQHLQPSSTIPEKFLLEILGPSNVYEQVIRKVINTATAQYVSKEGMNIGKDLEIVQSFEDLEAGFRPGGKFRFDAIFQFQDI